MDNWAVLLGRNEVQMEKFLRLFCGRACFDRLAKMAAVRVSSTLKRSLVQLGWRLLTDWFPGYRRCNRFLKKEAQLYQIFEHWTLEIEVRKSETGGGSLSPLFFQASRYGQNLGYQHTEILLLLFLSFQPNALAKNAGYRPRRTGPAQGERRKASVVLMRMFLPSRYGKLPIAAGCHIVCGYTAYVGSRQFLLLLRAVKVSNVESRHIRRLWNTICVNDDRSSS